VTVSDNLGAARSPDFTGLLIVKRYIWPDMSDPSSYVQIFKHLWRMSNNVKMRDGCGMNWREREIGVLGSAPVPDNRS
jgi:hypothetical protein